MTIHKTFINKIHVSGFESEFSSGSPYNMRWITYDASADSSRGGFWVGSYNDNFFQIDKLGNILDTISVTNNTIGEIMSRFMNQYNGLQNAIRNRGNVKQYESDEEFMKSLKKAVMISFDGKQINTSIITDKELINLITKYYQINSKFPYLNINKNVYSHSFKDNNVFI